MPLLVSIDLSTKSGYAVFKDGVLVDSGTVWPDVEIKNAGRYPENYVWCAMHYVENLLQTLLPHCDLLRFPAELTDVEVVVEETTASSNNYSQKILEFMHFYLIDRLSKVGIRPRYVRDGVWKRMTGANQNAEEKKLNAKIARIKKKTGTKLAKINGKVVGKRTKYHYYIRAANETFGMDLGRNDDNQAAAMLLGLAYLKGAPTCDGTLKGGLLPKEKK
jgi:hypothetical protein